MSSHFIHSEKLLQLNLKLWSIAIWHVVFQPKCVYACVFLPFNRYSLHGPFQFAELFLFLFFVRFFPLHSTHSNSHSFAVHFSIRIIEANRFNLTICCWNDVVYAARYKIQMKALVLVNGSVHSCHRRQCCRHGHHRQCINCMGGCFGYAMISIHLNKGKKAKYIVQCTCNFHILLFIKHDRIKCIYWCGFSAVSIRWNRINSWIDSTERMNNLCVLLLITLLYYCLSLSVSTSALYYFIWSWISMLSFLQ